MGSKGGNQTSQTYTPNRTVGQAGQQALTMGQTAANLPFQQQVAPVAEMPGDYASAFANMRNLQGAAQPYFGRGAELMNQSAQAISPGQIGNYMNPFAEYMLGGMRDLFGQQMKQTTGSLTQAAGGVGADRIGVAQSNLGKQQANAYGQALSGQYNNAVAAAQQDASRQQAAGFGFAQMGPAAQAALMSGTQGLMGIAGLQQQQRQAELNAPYQWDLARIQHQYQMPSYLSGLTAQTAQPLGGTTTTTYPQQSPWGTIAGLGMTAAGAYMGNPQMMSSGLKGASGANVGAGYGNQYGQFNPNVSGGFIGYGGSSPSMYGNRGGGVPYSQGGGVLPDMAGMGFQGGGPVWDEYGAVPYGGMNPFALEPPTESFSPPPAPPPSQPTPPGLPSSGEGSFGDRYSAVSDNPRIAAAMEFGESLPEQTPLPTRPSPGVGQTPGPFVPPTQDDGEDIPGGAQPTQGPPMMGGPPARMPTLQPVQHTPINIPPDTGQGGFARNPWLGLMQAGLATMAASGQRDARGLPTPPLAAIGKGGMEGVGVLREQDKEATARRRVDFEAGRLQIAAEEARRQAEAHPLEQQQRQIANIRNAQITSQQAQLHPLELQQKRIEHRKAEIALKALEAGDAAMNDQSVLDSVGLTKAQATFLGPAGVRTVLQDMAKARYKIQDVDGVPWAVDTLHPERSRPIGGGGRGQSAYGLGESPQQPPPSILGTQPPAPRPGVNPPVPPGVPAPLPAAAPTVATGPVAQAFPTTAPVHQQLMPNTPAPPPIPVTPAGAQPAGPQAAAPAPAARPQLGSAQSGPERAGVAPDYAGAFGPASVLTWLGLKATDIRAGTASDQTFLNTVARNDLASLRDRIITARSSGRPEARLKMVQERIDQLIPKGGRFFAGPQEGLAAFTTVLKDLDNDIIEHSRVIDPRSTGYGKADSKERKDSGRALLELHSVRNQVVTAMKFMAMPTEIRNNPGMRVTPSGAVIIPDPQNPGKFLEWRP